MAEEQHHSALPINKAMVSERQVGGELDLESLKNTLTKSSLWKANTLQRIEDTRAESSDDSKDAVLASFKQSLLKLVDQHWRAYTRKSASVDARDSDGQGTSLVDDDSEAARREAKMQNAYTGVRQALAVQVQEVINVKRQLREQETTLQTRRDEIANLRQTIEELQAENSRLSEHHKSELEGREVQLFDLQGAYDQFQQQSDQLLSELERENAQLRIDK
ncbi:MAG: hypothetical protein ACR2QZ_04235 [Woeseiaceae bacterium]